MRFLFILILLTYSSLALANEYEYQPYEGFYSKENASHFLSLETINHTSASTFKLYLQTDYQNPLAAHGTAFTVKADGVLVTNVHNMTQCLRKYDLLETGYDGSRGPLKCDNFVLIGSDNTPLSGVYLLGSEPRYGGFDLSIIKVSGLNGPYMDLSNWSVGMKIFGAGFPGETKRNKSFLTTSAQLMKNNVEQIYDHRELLTADVGIETLITDMFKLFGKIAPTLLGSEYLAAATNGRFFDSGLMNFDLEPSLFVKRAKPFLEETERRVFSLQKIINLASLQAPIDYPNASNGFKFTKGEILTHSNGVLEISGDGLHGSSGSAYVNENGKVVGLLFALGVNVLDPTSLCHFDAYFTNFESIKYQYCINVRINAVSSDIIKNRISRWVD